MRIRNMDLFKRIIHHDNEQYELKITIRGNLPELKKIQSLLASEVSKNA